jgi:hypothetical protein
MRRIGVAVLVLLAGGTMLLGGCGGEEETGAQLVALPTRTPLPVTETPTGSAAPQNVEIVSLQGQIDAFLTASETAGALDRIDLFNEYVLNQIPGCFQSTLWPDMEPLEIIASQGLNLPTAPMEDWRASADNFPEEQLIQAVGDALGRAELLLPSDRRLRICLVPVPPPATQEDVPNAGLSSLVLGADLAVISCAAGPTCLDKIGQEVAHGYASAYQIGQSGLTGVEIPLLAFAITSGRADDFARQLFPGAVFPWTDALTPEQEVDVWSRMQEYLATTYSDYPGYRNMDRFLYGGANSTRYPRFGGLYIGGRIAAAYRARHPDAAPADLMALTPETLLAESGYAPG